MYNLVCTTFTSKIGSGFERNINERSRWQSSFWLCAQAYGVVNQINTYVYTVKNRRMI